MIGLIIVGLGLFHPIAWLPSWLAAIWIVGRAYQIIYSKDERTQEETPDQPATVSPESDKSHEKVLLRTARSEREQSHDEGVLVESNVGAPNSLPLTEAVAAGDAEKVRLLLKEGSNANSVEAVNNWTVLMRACYRGDVPIVNSLLAWGAVVDERAIRLAKRRWHPEIVKILETRLRSHEQTTDSQLRES